MSHGTSRRLLSAAAVLPFLFTPATALASTPHAHLALGADALTVRVGSPIQLVGTLTPKARTTVYLQRFVAGHWVGLSHGTTSATGSYAFAVKAPGKPTTWVFRVVRGATASHTLHVKVSTSAFKVQAKASATNVAVGRPLVVTGTVSPKATGPVRLQILRGKTWATLSTARLTTHSTFTLSASRPAGAYKLRVVKPYTATIAAGVSATQLVAVVDPGTPTPPPVIAAQPSLSYGTPDDAVLAEGGARLVFSAVQGQPLPPARAFTVTNNGDGAATVSGLAISGTGASSYGLAADQPTSFTVPAHGSATVSVAFHPTAPTNCPGDIYAISDSNRDATLSFATSDGTLSTGSVTLSGVVSCGFGGANEPVLHQIVQALGYSTVVDTPSGDQRFLKLQGAYPGTDEVTARYFRAADASQPVSLTDLAHYSSPNTQPYEPTGWYAKGAAVPPGGTCPAAVCHTLWEFPADPSATAYNQNQDLMPTVLGVTTFNPGTVFGLYAGDDKGSTSDFVFSDDALNDSTLPHDVRVYPAYGPGRALIPNTYLVAVDIGRASGSKNEDFQDQVMVLRNVVPAG